MSWNRPKDKLIVINTFFIVQRRRSLCGFTYETPASNLEAGEYDVVLYRLKLRDTLLHFFFDSQICAHDSLAKMEMVASGLNMKNSHPCTRLLIDHNVCCVCSRSADP
jgi:hypothetical protein